MMENADATTDLINEELAKAQKGRIRRRALVRLILFLIVYGSLHVLSGAIIRPPQNLHDASIPAINGILSSNIVLSTAISADLPGLILDCVYSDELTKNPRITTWRSRDYGQHWEILNNPFQTWSCEFIAPQGGGTTFLAYDRHAEDEGSFLWISHDAGSSWHQVSNIMFPLTTLQALAHSYYRDGRLYALFPQNGVKDAPLTFNVSSDDGTTWLNPTVVQSTLKAQGWQVQSVAPDYRVPHSWFRVLTDGKEIPSAAPMLEHSMDDGQHWQSITALGYQPAGNISLATTSATPNELCVSNDRYLYDHTTDSYLEGNLTLLASFDGGLSWRTAEAPTNPPPLSNGDLPRGEVRSNTQIGNDGSCYQARTFDWEPPHGPISFEHLKTTIFSFPAHAEHLKVVAELEGTALGGDPLNTFVYVDSSHNEGRLFIAPLIFHDGWHSFWQWIGIMTANFPNSSPLIWLTLP
jgi:hypothetical protein